MRIYQLICGLAERHRVTCLSFAPDAAAEAALEPLRAHCRVLVVRGPGSRSLARRAWTTAASPMPDMALRNHSASYAQRLRDLLASETFDIVQAESIEMAGYLAAAQRLPRPPLLVLDQFNAEYVLQKRAALTSLAELRNGRLTPRHIAGAAYSWAQWIKLARYERQMMRHCNLTLAVSHGDRQIMQRLAPGTPIELVPNGVDTAAFQRAAIAHERAGPFSFGGDAIVFSGTLDFRPNIDAVAWFCQDVLPLIQAQRPQARLIVVGKRPAPAVLAQASAAVTIIGEVPDARPYLAGADVYIVPMRIGGGVRLKLLEALALAAAVVSTTVGAEGLVGLRHGQHCMVADQPQAFADAVLKLLGDREAGRTLGANGRALVQAGYDWRTIVPQLEQLYTVRLAAEAAG